LKKNIVNIVFKPKFRGFKSGVIYEFLQTNSIFYVHLALSKYFDIQNL